MDPDDEQTPPATEVFAPAEPTTEEPTTDEPEAKVEREGSFTRELPILIIIAFALALVIKTFLMQAFFIPSESMLPTLERGDRVLVNKVIYRFREPRRGEIVVFHERRSAPRSFGQRIRSLFTEGFGGASPDGRDFIKRVIALPGETVEVTQDAVYVTPAGGKRAKLDEPYVFEPGAMGEEQPPLTLTEDEFFVMGDNRENSQDSRVIGPVKRDALVGKAFVRIWPVRRFAVFDTPAYPDLARAPS